MLTEIENAIGELPDKLSDLLEVALNDFEEVTKHPQVVVDMGSWCWPHRREHGFCYVCLAGSVIANRVGVDMVLGTVHREITPGLFKDQMMQKLAALDSLRDGDIEMACHEMGVDRSDGCPSFIEVWHRNGSPGFIPEMRSLVTLLRTHGL